MDHTGSSNYQGIELAQGLGGGGHPSVMLALLIPRPTCDLGPLADLFSSEAETLTQPQGPCEASEFLWKMLPLLVLSFQGKNAGVLEATSVS